MTDPSRKQLQLCQSATEQSLDELYAGGISIETYIAERAIREPFIDNDTPPHPHQRPSPAAAFFGPSKLSDEERTKLKNRQWRVWQRVKAELIREELVALGWRQKDDDGFRIVERIKKRFWVAARLREGWNEAKEYETRLVFHDICIVEAARPEAHSGAPQANITEPSAELKKPDLSKMDRKQRRELAINACASPNQLEWWQKSQDDRRSGYVEYLMQFGFDPRRVYGYGADSWEQSEQKYKKARGLLRTQIA